jgi:hypothetical protein
MKALEKILSYLRHHFWTGPTTRPLEPKATDVSEYYTVVTYRGQMINLHNSELPVWSHMSRYDKRGMARKFEKLEKEGKICFVEMDGKMICVKNKDYGQSRNKSGKGTPGSRKQPNITKVRSGA